MKPSPVAVVIVTHNSEPFIERCLAALGRSDLPPSQVILVDAGSDSSSWLEALASSAKASLIKSPNIGFSRANNLGYQACLPSAEFILFLNPDALVASQTLRCAASIMDRAPDIGCLTGRLLGYDITKDQPTGLLDSTGIFRKWYGRWYDRGQGEADRGQFSESGEVPAACGAFMFCRRTALAAAALKVGEIFDPAFFMYKEDIELSLRLRSVGWRVVYDPCLMVHHCRGWNRQRKVMPLARRTMAAANEVLLYRRHPSPYIIWALFKYMLVRLFAL